MVIPLEERIPPTLCAASTFLLRQISYLDLEAQDQVAKALFFAARWHYGQLRKAGQSYILHPIQVAGIISVLKADAPSIIAALLHDTLEDSEVTPSEIERKFSKEVRILVEALTKHAAFSHREYAEKVYTRSKEDGRVAVVKVADTCANLMRHDQLLFSATKHLEHVHEARELYLAWLVPLPGFPAELARMLNRLIAESQQDYDTRPDKLHA